MGTEVGSIYEHCCVGYMFALLARLLPAHIIFPVVVPGSIWAGIAAPELVLSSNYVNHFYTCCITHHLGVLRWVGNLYVLQLNLCSNTVKYQCGNG